MIRNFRHYKQKNQLERKECNAAQVLYLHMVSSYIYISFQKNLFCGQHNSKILITIRNFRHDKQTDR